MNSNGYVLFFINTLDTIVKESNLFIVSDSGGYLVEADEGPGGLTFMSCG